MCIPSRHRVALLAGGVAIAVLLAACGSDNNPGNADASAPTAATAGPTTSPAPEGLSTEFLTDLGFRVPRELDAFTTGEGQAYVPLEQLTVLNAADVLLWATETPDDRGALEAEPVYKTLEEVQAGRLVFTDGLTAGAIYFTSPLSLQFVLDHLVPALASTIAGDGPATIATATG